MGRVGGRRGGPGPQLQEGGGAAEEGRPPVTGRKEPPQLEWILYRSPGEATPAPTQGPAPQGLPPSVTRGCRGHSWSSAQMLCTCRTSRAHGKHRSVQPLPSGGQAHLRSTAHGITGSEPRSPRPEGDLAGGRAAGRLQEGFLEQQAAPIPPGGQVQK